MQKLTQAVELETTFGLYAIDEVIGEGGAGRVYGGTGPDQAAVAIKVLSRDRLTRDRQHRFKNEIAFLLRTKHPNIVAVTDHGVATDEPINGPFYVMPRYHGSLRDLMSRRIAASDVLSLFAKMLDGVEAAHLLGAIHRDLKPENILLDAPAKNPAIADFGIASFTDDLVVTTVETLPGQRLANFQYAAPEQRKRGGETAIAADVYALGLMLNEMFTGEIPHGTEYRPIEAVNKDYAYLDAVIAKMIRQNPGDRYQNIAELKAAISHHHAEFQTIQKLSRIDATVIPAGEVDDPLAFNPPKLVGANWDNGILTLTLDREVSAAWVRALQTMGNYTSVMNIGPERFQFSGKQARVHVSEGDAQRVVNFFKEWLPQATRRLKYNLENEMQEQRRQREEKLKRERANEEQRLRVNKSLII
jgi:serine/threonine protein kinase